MLDYQLMPKKCASLIQDANYVIAFSGAGISTTAGIPDFRSPQGIYSTHQFDPRTFDLQFFLKHPEGFYQFAQELIDILRTTQPTFTHRFIAQLEHHHMLRGVITQNIDTLHQMAGSKNIIELHGSYYTASCVRCNVFRESNLDIDWWQDKIVHSPRSPVPICPRCDGIIKPGMVFFGEPVLDMEKARDWIARCDLMLVLGSSLNVYPAALIPQLADATIVVVNKGSVSLAPAKDRYFIDSDVDTYFRQVAQYLGIDNIDPE